jgi:hypothetical protein
MNFQTGMSHGAGSLSDGADKQDGVDSAIYSMTAFDEASDTYSYDRVYPVHPC